MSEATADGARASALARVRRRLLDAGADEHAIERAVDDDVVDLLAVDSLIVPSRNRYSPRQVADAAGLPLETLRQMWRAAGFLDTPDDEPGLTDLDLQAAHEVRRLLELGVVGLDTVVQLARVIGAAMARVAEAELLRAAEMLGAAEDSVAAADAFSAVAEDALGATSRLLEFAWRRHTQAVARRAVGLRLASRRSGSNPVVAVGFADMVGFTLMSQHLGSEELAMVVRRFEEIAYDTVTAHGGRVVKTIGDEVMFVTHDAPAAAAIGVHLSEAYADDDLLGDVRVGLAAGEVLVRDGDYFGPTVNLAARIVGIAEPGTVLVSDDLHAMLDPGGELTGKPLRPRTLKDVGRVQLWTCTRRGAGGVRRPRSRRARASSRLERLAFVLADLDEDGGDRAANRRRRDGR